MATMWPDPLPDWILQDSRRSAEINVYRHLQSALDDLWQVYYSRPWWGLNLKGGEVDGEADFIAAHPEQGILFLEVKGGRISFDPATEKWQTTDRHGIRHNIKDPVRQAMSCRYRIMGRLAKVGGWPSVRVRSRYGVIFPDSMPPPPEDEMLGGYEKHLFCHAREFDWTFGQWILDRMKKHHESSGSEHGPGVAGMGILSDVLAKPVTLRVPVARQIDGVMTSMEQLLTGAQLAILSQIESMGNVLIEGGAGTGKTVLALEMASRAADKGKSVLYCCLGEALAVYVSERLGVDHAIGVYTAINIPRSRQWDIVIVDEAQDFDRDWWDPVMGSVAAGGRFVVFADSNQAIYRLRDDIETRLGASSYFLKLNLRNTRKIATVTEHLYSGPLIELCGPEGDDPEVFICEFDKALDGVAGKVVDLVRNESVNPSSIAVLLPDASHKKTMQQKITGLGLTFTDGAARSSSSIVIETIARFKGLESPVIILLANRASSSNQEMAYVGVSRSRARLYVYGPITGTILHHALQSEGQ